MKPILYEENEREFRHNGLGILSDTIDCDVYWRLNGRYVLELIYPVTGLHFKELKQRRIILAKADNLHRTQPFRIYRISKPLSKKVTVYARHVAYDMMGIPVAPYSAMGVGSALLGLKENAVEECPFSFDTNKTTDSAMVMKTPRSMWEMLGGTEGSILDVYGGEWEFDRWDVRLWNHLGTDRGVQIRYGKNLTDLKQDENCAGCYTVVYPYWTNSAGDYLELPERKVAVEGQFGYTRTLVKDFSEEWMERPTEEQLRERTVKYIKDNDIGVPKVGWKVEFVQLEQTVEYRGRGLLEQVGQGDTVRAEFAQMDISASARATETHYKPLLERFESVYLGSVRSDFADIIVNTRQEAAKKPSGTAMEQAIMVLTATLLGARGGAVQLLDQDGDGMPDTLYIADHPDPNKAVKVWRFNYEGWGASETGFSGPYIMGATFEQGLLAAFITAGILKSADGKTYFDLDNSRIVCELEDGTRVLISNGQVQLADANGVVRATMEKRAGVLEGEYGFGLYNAAGENVARFSTYEDYLMISAPKQDGSGKVGLAAGWRTIDGITYLTGI